MKRELLIPLLFRLSVPLKSKFVVCVVVDNADTPFRECFRETDIDGNGKNTQRDKGR